MAINEKLKYYRAKNNFTQTQVSAALGIDRSTYSYYELGKTIPSINMLSNIAKLFNVAIFDLLDTEKGSDHLSSTTYNPGYYSGERPLSSATLDREEKDLLQLTAGVQYQIRIGNTRIKENRRKGRGTIAAPVIGKIFDNILPYLGIEKQ